MHETRGRHHERRRRLVHLGEPTCPLRTRRKRSRSDHAARFEDFVASPPAAADDDVRLAADAGERAASPQYRYVSPPIKARNPRGSSGQKGREDTELSWHDGIFGLAVGTGISTACPSLMQMELSSAVARQLASRTTSPWRSPWLPQHPTECSNQAW